jgi:hydroxyacylglutathione hydrolase
MDIQLIPAFADNYIYLLVEGNAVGIVDPGDAEPVFEALSRRSLTPTHIFNTHHHSDHIGGNEALVHRFGCPVIAPRSEAGRIAGIGQAVAEGDTVAFGSRTATVIETPGHTRGHIAFWFDTAGPDDPGAVFCGDTLFALGCGRLFEGTPDQMWRSLGKLRGLPPETRVYCGHEYTLSNARFAITVDPENAALKQRAADVSVLRDQGRPTIPSTIGAERATNPFLRADDPAVQRAVGLDGADPVAVFAEIRRRKDTF